MPTTSPVSNCVSEKAQARMVFGLVKVQLRKITARRQRSDREACPVRVHLELTVPRTPVDERRQLHPDRGSLLNTFQRYMEISKQSAPQLASRMEALESGMLALLGQHQA